MYAINIASKFKGMSEFAINAIVKTYLNDFKIKQISLREKMKIHKCGFTVTNWKYLGLTEETSKEYLSNVQYFNMHPLNGEYSKWIDDKLTLKYILSGTVLDEYLPRYYFQIDAKGNMLRLMDFCLEEKGNVVDDFVALLKEKKELAIKRIAGAIGEGFYKAQYNKDLFYLNGEEYNEKVFREKIKQLKNYLITEYLKPHREIAEYCSETANSIRYLIGRVDGEMRMLKSFIRFGTKKSKFVENYNAGGVLCYINEVGEFNYGNVIDAENLRNIIVYEHPDSKKELKGKVPLWDEIVKVKQMLDKIFPQMEYLGVDFVVTSDNKVKMLEINSLTSLDALQMDVSILKTDVAEFFLKRIKNNQ